MLDKIINSSLANWAGGSTFILSVYFKTMEWLNIANFNDVLVTISSLIGIVFIVFKVISIRKNNKETDKKTELLDIEIELKQRELDKK